MQLEYVKFFQVCKNAQQRQITATALLTIELLNSDISDSEKIERISEIFTASNSARGSRIL